MDLEMKNTVLLVKVWNGEIYPSTRVHSSRMCTACSLPWGSLSGGSLSRGVSVQGGLYPGGLCPGGSLSRGVSVHWSLSRGSLSREVSVWGVYLTETTPGNRMTHRCKNITFPQLHLQAVTISLLAFMGSYQWRIQDFPKEGAPTLQGGANIRFCQNFPKTAWNWKNLDPRGGGGARVQNFTM